MESPQLFQGRLGEQLEHNNFASLRPGVRSVRVHDGLVPGLQGHPAELVFLQGGADPRLGKNDPLHVGDVIVQDASLQQAVREPPAEDHSVRHEDVVVQQSLQELVAQGPRPEGEHQHFRAGRLQIEAGMPPRIQRDNALEDCALAAAGQGMDDLDWGV